jgi:hypothetical protein
MVNPPATGPMSAWMMPECNGQGVDGSRCSGRGEWWGLMGVGGGLVVEAGSSCASIWVRDKNRGYTRGNLDLCRFSRGGWGYAGQIGRFSRADGPCETMFHPLNMNLHPLNLFSHPLNIVSHPLKFVLHPLNIVSHRSNIVSHGPSIVSNGPKTRTHAWAAAFQCCVRASKPSEVAANPSK